MLMSNADNIYCNEEQREKSDISEELVGSLRFKTATGLI